VRRYQASHGKKDLVTRSALGLLALVITTLGAAACATGRAQIPEPEPTLVVPPVPPRSIEPPPVVEPQHEPETTEAPSPPPAPRPNRSRPAAEAKPEPKQEPKQDPQVETVGPVPNPPPVAQLRTPTTPTGPEAVRQVKEILDATQKMLDSVGSLTSDDRKANYATARSLVQQSEESLKKEELTQARSFAERAQQIAKVLLSGR
jgi:outer membrane biosynthesis protein TonB